MNHRFTALLAQQLRKRVGLLQAENMQSLRIDKFPMPAREIVDDGDVVALLGKKTNGVRADIPGAAGNQDSFH